MQSSVHGTTTYSYDEGDRLLQMVNPDSSVTEFTWDANGNMTRKGDIQYLFDSANRLTQVIDGEDVVLFTYDGDGHRLTKVVNGVKSQYATDLATALPQVLTETRERETTAYTYGLGLNSLDEPSRDGAITMLTDWGVCGAELRIDQLATRLRDTTFSAPLRGRVGAA